MSHQQDIPRHSKDSFIFCLRKTGEFRVKIRKVWSTQMKKFWLAPISNKSLLPLPFQLCPVQTRYYTQVLNYFVCDVVHCKCIPTFPAFMHPLSLCSKVGKDWIICTKMKVEMHVQIDMADAAESLAKHEIWQLLCTLQVWWQHYKIKHHHFDHSHPNYSTSKIIAGNFKIGRVT